MRFIVLVLLLFYISGCAQALNPISIKGNKFFDSKTKKQFFIKGVAYQPRNGESHIRNNTDVIIDPLTDTPACKRDAALMKKLGLNLIRVYEVDPSKDHNGCMKAFEDAGIYLLLDIATPKFSINRETPEYDTRLYAAYTKTVDAFLKYNNVMGFIAGNEVTNDKSNTPASAFVKAAVRDVKKHIRSKANKDIPVGYAGNDDGDIRDAIKDYFACGDEEEQADFFGVNMYEWCGRSSFQKSGYAERTKEFTGYTKPVFMSEYGCNLVTPRPFTEVEAIYGPEMTGVWSGGVVYEWSQEQNNYGLVQITPDGKAKPLTDFHNLQKALAQVGDDNTLAENAATMDDIKTVNNVSCPSSSDQWKASTKLPPTPSDDACNCMRDNLSCMASDKVIGSNGKITSAVGEQIDMLCGMVSCDEISNDGEKGRYGAYAFCSPTEKLSYLYHLYMENNKDGKCDFDGNAKIAKPKRSDMNDCSTLSTALACFLAIMIITT
ncbi:hypothetical protein K492DRAFT_217546 [Lichtheimia hyalospora FSU 10163]|nr:hypothetical protein K492DRAFT_217546 [Lichtheimia hyalospora FSU 10163]